jgi:excisionase family DNA binding protein
MKNRGRNTPAKGETSFYTIKETADILRVHPSTVERMIRDRRVSSCRPVHKRLIPKSEIHGLINGNWTPATPPE